MLLMLSMIKHILFPKHASSMRGSYINMERNWFIAALWPRVGRPCLRQPSRKFGTLPLPLSCQIAIFGKNVDTSHAKSMFLQD